MIILAIIGITAWIIGMFGLWALLRQGKRTEWSLPKSDYDDDDPAGGCRA